MQIKYINVAFKKDGKNYSFSPNNLRVNNGDYVVVETVRGVELGQCTSAVLFKDDSTLLEPLKPILRIADEKDLKQKEENNIKEREIKVETEKIIKKHNLEMKIVDVEMSLYGNKLLIYFSSDNRVDFRDLVKELAGKFKSRIELRQIGDRDETRLMGGLGPCGRECCCHLFLDNTSQSTIKMAKIQNLSLNPVNISGLCGRLKCCIAYENPTYLESFNLMPKINTEVRTPRGVGLVVYNDLLNRKSLVRFGNKDAGFEEIEFSLDEIKVMKDEK